MIGRRSTIVVAASLLSAAALTGLALRHHDQPVPVVPLADRINQACGPGYHVGDWEAWGAVVKVTCESDREDRYGMPADSYVRAVGRG